MINTYEDVRVLGQPRRCIRTNASRGLSAMAEFLVLISVVTDAEMPVTYRAFLLHFSLLRKQTTAPSLPDNLLP